MTDKRLTQEQVAGFWGLTASLRELPQDEAPADEHPGADYTLAGPVDECEGLDGQPIAWEDGEVGITRYE